MNTDGATGIQIMRSFSTYCKTNRINTNRWSIDKIKLILHDNIKGTFENVRSVDRAYTVHVMNTEEIIKNATHAPMGYHRAYTPDLTRSRASHPLFLPRRSNSCTVS